MQHRPFAATLLLLAAAMTLICPSTARAQGRKIRVPQDHPTIQHAIDFADDGDTVIVDDGVWSGPGNKNLDYFGLAITVKSKNGPDNCIIDCEGDGRGVWFHSDESPSSVLEAASADRIVVTLEPFGVDPENLRPGQLFEVLVSLSAESGNPIEEIRHMQFDTRRTSGSNVLNYEWRLGEREQNYFLDESLPVVGANHIVGPTLDLDGTPRVVGLYTVRFFENGELNLIGKPNEPNTDKGIRFRAGFANPVEYSSRNGNVVGGTLRLGCNDCQACCFRDAECQDLLPVDCSLEGGEPQGDGSECATADCPFPSCQRVRRLKVRCTQTSLTGTVISSLIEGTVLRLVVDNAFFRDVRVNFRGIARASWRNPVQGPHQICIDQCDTCATTVCSE